MPKVTESTRQQEKFLVLMQHYNEAMGYSEEATNSAGTALDKYQNSYLKSVEAAQDRVTASFESLSQTFLNSDLIVGAFNTGAGLLGFLNDVMSLGDGVIYKIGLIAAAAKLLDTFKIGRILPTIPESNSTVGISKLVNCWETHLRYYSYKVA